jgi:hypothetical protein
VEDIDRGDNSQNKILCEKNRSQKKEEWLEKGKMGESERAREKEKYTF